jgi:hypothetical protein
MFRCHRLSLPCTLLAVLLIAQGTLSTDAAGQNTPPEDDSGKAPKDEDKGKKDEPKKRRQTAAECVSHTTEARHVMGYDHLVHIKNACDSEATCKVSTDVNPKVELVTIAVGQTKTVLTFRGSPAREFKVTLECRLATE